LALIHLQSLNEILNTLYGNILIIKLSQAFLMILIGRYNQTKIQNYITLVKNIKMNNDNNNLDIDIFIKDNKKRNVFFKDINKSIKIESLIGISVLVAASFLSLTSPTSLATTTTNQDINESNTGADISTNTNNMDFYAMSIILSIIIIIEGLINLRKNQQKVKDIYKPNPNGGSL
jgi:copper transport protein